MKKVLRFCFLALIFSICFVPYGGVPSVNFGTRFAGQAYVSILSKAAAPAADYYIQQSDGNACCFRSLKTEKNRTFGKILQYAVFSDVQKKFNSVFYPPYLCACSVRCISLSKFKKLTIYRQTVL